MLHHNLTPNASQPQPPTPTAQPGRAVALADADAGASNELNHRPWVVADNPESKPNSNAVFFALGRLGNLDVSPAAKLVLLSLANHTYTPRSLAFPSAETIAGEIGVSVSAVRRSLRQLERRRIIVALPPSRGRVTTRYAMPGYADERLLLGAAQPAQPCQIDTVDAANPSNLVANPSNLTPESLLISNNLLGIRGDSKNFLDGEEDEKQLQPQPQPPAAPDAAENEGAPGAPSFSTTAAPHDAVTCAWLDTFGELTDEQRGFLFNAVRTYSDIEVLRALALAADQLDKGKKIARPAKYVKTILTNRMNQIGAGNPKTLATTAPSPATAQNAPPTPDTPSQPAAEAPQGDQAETAAAEAEAEAKRQEVKARLAAEDRDRAAAAAADRADRAEQERIAADQRQIEREFQNQAAAAAAADRKRQEVAKQIAAATGDNDHALRIVSDFLREVDPRLQRIRLDSLTVEHNRTKAPVAPERATAILHGGLTAVGAQARVAA